jgi:formate hydrogenlyase transcriptional activator
MATDAIASRSNMLIPFEKNDFEAEGLMEGFFSASSAGLCILDTELRFVAINSVLASMNGIAVRDHIGKTLREVLGDFADVIEPEMRNVFSTGQPVLNFEVSAIVPSRTEPGHWIEDYFPIRDENGVVTRIGAVVIEITEQKKLKASVNEMSRKLRKQMEELQMLLEVTHLLASNWGNVPEIFPRISALLRRILHHEYSGVQVYDGETGTLKRQVDDLPFGKGLLSTANISLKHSPGGRCLEEQAPLIFSLEQIRTFDSEITKSFLSEGFQSLCCVPLLRPKGPLGVLVLGSTRANAFQKDNLSLLNQVGAQFALALENQRAASEIVAFKERLTEERGFLEGDVRGEGHFAEIIGESPTLKSVLNLASVVAASNATVLVLGETGTGKELIARAIHRMSQRKDRNFVKVNCAAIPTGLLESELFGHEKGAFTGAITQKIGRMELAHGGTLFLDEVGEIPLELQPKLLRVLQDQEFERLGSIRTIKVDVRLVTATNRDLARGVAEREFRSDLFYRINVFPLHLPSLRERPGDVPLLVRYFVHKFEQRLNRQIEIIPREAMQALMAWHWPGNVRELENLIERSVILSPGPILRVPLSEIRVAGATAPALEDHTLDATEREHILRILRESDGVLSGPNGAARRLGVKRTTLQSKMKRLHIDRQEYDSRKRG